MARPLVAVIGAGDCDASTAAIAEDVGRRLAEAGLAVVTGGLGGVMEAASRGAARAGGLVVGVLPTASVADANPFVDIAIATGMGDARNVVLANTAAAFIAVGGRYGTLSEIAFARKRGKPVVGIGTWVVDASVSAVSEPAEAVAAVLAALHSPPSAGSGSRGS